ncbi:hypothetical protein E8E12_006125 [Didymella heteroderae]|uniref:Uncharacterized protein n=1 Tax=Didymella heteroderae TaxID=1769908 RepID=A0A9P4WWW7_9PLEO|nr:hypothetical protein E8E12_006125 [Didymella heteroderae]
MAGLVTAHLLKQDRRERYAVKVFESGSTLSLDSASVSIPNAARTASERVDLPMRAFAGGFYSNLRAMYDYLSIHYQSQPFLFEFAQSRSPYFAHASNLHQLPVRPNGVKWTSYLLEFGFLTLCYVYFSLCCFFVAPHPGETLRLYFKRTWMPEHFVTYYVLPLISSVTTCPHDSLLAFPATDLTEYKQRTHRAPHYTVSEGVRAAQDRLAKGIQYELNAAIVAVEPQEKGVRLSWNNMGGPQTEFFDKVVLAVAPDIVGQVFKPLQQFIKIQCKKLLKYSGVLLLFILLLSELASPLPCEADKQRVKLRIAASVLIVVVPTLSGSRTEKGKKTVYGLQHGRLHLNAHRSEAEPSRSKSLAEACRDLLDLVLAEADFSKETATDRTRCLIDAGFGCGEQTIHLMSEKPLRPSDKLWWDDKVHQVYFDHYVGITQDKTQHQYAQQRVDEMKKDKVSVFCADASTPWLWSEDLFQTSHKAQNITQETWCLALDTAYHFSPSRWVFYHHMWRYYTASIMAFDLCLSPTATLPQKIVLRILTTLMGAPWANFDTPEVYRQKLIGLGYPADGIKVIDISEHVFAPLSEFLEEQDSSLKMIGVNPMSGSVRLLIREFAMELWRRGGYLVEYEYTSDADADEEEEIEVEDEDEDESDELDIDGHVVDNRTSTEYGFAKKA